MSGWEFFWISERSFECVGVLLANGGSLGLVGESDPLEWGVSAPLLSMGGLSKASSSSLLSLQVLEGP